MKDAQIRLSDMNHMMVLLWFSLNAMIEFSKIMFPSTTMNPGVQCL